MSIVSILQVTGPASAAGTVLGTQSPTEGASWARLTGLGTIPPGGALLDVNANSADIRVAVVPNDGPGLFPPPPHNGDIVQLGRPFRVEIEANSQVWTKQL